MKNSSLPDNPTQICSRCIMDCTAPGITFNREGVCNFCQLHDKLEKDYPNGAKGQRIIRELVGRIKASAKGRKYDCIVGISGGRDSTYTLYFTKSLGLNPLAVHFNDGFSNPRAGENMIKACRRLGVDLRTITSDWRESKDLRVAFLKASTPDLEEATDVGIATALYGVAAKEKIRYILFGQSFRTEGIAPLSWNYLDGKYLNAVHKQFGTFALRKWTPTDPGFNLGIKHVIYYSLIKKIKTIPILYYVHYVRTNAERIIKQELGWENTGAHYFDDLYQALMTYVYRVKFNIDRRKLNYSALIRSGQMSREEALERCRQVYVIEDPDIIRLCIKRLGLTQEEFDAFLRTPIKTYRDYPNSYALLEKFKIPIKILSKLNFLPGSTYDKYFSCGE